jgi:hypothetical protein
MQSGLPVAALFVLGEWGTVKSHCLAFIRCLARTRNIRTVSLLVNARTLALNYPQRLYPSLAENLRWESERLGLREVLTHSLAEPANRERLAGFSKTSAGDLTRQLQFLAHLSGEEAILSHEAEWAWAAVLGGDLGWADYAYKREQAVARVQVIASMSRHLGHCGLVVTFDEAETIDQLWNVRSRFVAYDVLGRLCSTRALWPVFGITDRFVRVVGADLQRYGIDAPLATEHARRFLKAWSLHQFDVVEPPEIGIPEANQLADKIVSLYSRAYPLANADGRLAKRCVDEWVRNASRNPRRLIRLAVHRLDLLRIDSGSSGSSCIAAP